MIKKEKFDIDAVILWVDGSDPEWQKEKNKYEVDKKQDACESRYRDWEILKYILRSICVYAPWIRKVHLVTCGQSPGWLNWDCDKLNFVTHEDFIPNACLPTFSSQAIDLNIHRIEDLAEHFIYFNDDMLLTNYVNPKDFFVNGLPRDMFSERPICHGDGVFAHNMINNMEVLSRNFSRQVVLKRQWKKILSPCYGKVFFYNLLWYILPYKKFCGLYINHLPLSYKKSTWEKVWDLYPEEMESTITNRFRTITDLNQFVCQFYALMTGDFFPTNMDKQGHYFNVVDDNNEYLYKSVREHKFKRICINDNCSDAVFLRTKEKVLACLDEILPGKSEFEK